MATKIRYEFFGCQFANKFRLFYYQLTYTQTLGKLASDSIYSIQNQRRAIEITLKKKQIPFFALFFLVLVRMIGRATTTSVLSEWRFQTVLRFALLRCVSNLRAVQVRATKSRQKIHRPKAESTEVFLL